MPKDILFRFAMQSSGKTFLFVFKQAVAYPLTILAIVLISLQNRIWKIKCEK